MSQKAHPFGHAGLVDDLKQKAIIDRAIEIAKEQSKQNFTLHPDGSMTVHDVHIDADKTGQLASWAESENVSLGDMATRQIFESLEATMNA